MTPNPSILESELEEKFHFVKCAAPFIWLCINGEIVCEEPTVEAQAVKYVRYDLAVTTRDVEAESEEQDINTEHINDR